MEYLYIQYKFIDTDDGEENNIYDFYLLEDITNLKKIKRANSDDMTVLRIFHKTENPTSFKLELINYCVTSSKFIHKFLTSYPKIDCELDEQEV